MLYAALGDSITHGYEATDPERRFVSRLRYRMARQGRISTFIQAKPGWTSKQLLKSLPSVPECIWEEAKCITVLVGGNDILRAVPWVVNGDAGKAMLVAEKFRDHLTQILRIIKRRQNRVFLATLYNPFPNYIVAKECTHILNQAIISVAAREHVRLVDLERAFSGQEKRWIEGYKEGELKDFKLRNNPIHPNDAGHEAIADLFFKAYRQSLKPPLKSQARSKKQQFRSEATS